MSALQIMNLIVTICYYLIDAFFLFAIVKTFIKTKKLQDAWLYALVMIPFTLRLLHLK